MADNSSWILDNLNTSILVLDNGLCLAYMNSAAEMLFAHSFRQSKGIPFKDLAHPPKELIDLLQKALVNGHPFTERELCLTVSGDQTIKVDCTVTPVLDKFSFEGKVAPKQPNRQRGELPPLPFGNPIGKVPAASFGVLENQAQHAKLLIELQQVDRQLRINREEHLLMQQDTARALVRNLAHEVKNPLGGLRGAAQLLEREFSDPSLKEYTRIIIREADRLRNLVDCMLGPTRPPDYQPINIHAILEQVRQLVQAETGDRIHIQQDYDPSIPPLNGDFDQLIQAVLNIMSNAVHALGGGGRILLRTRVQRQQTIGHIRHKLLMRLDIIDDGPGVPEHLQEKIFYPMISGQDSGTGLGLSIAQLIVNQHGGLIEFSSQPGETVFTLLLPLDAQAGEHA